jgi:hypothetical protein
MCPAASLSAFCALTWVRWYGNLNCICPFIVSLPCMLAAPIFPLRREDLFGSALN